MKALHDRDLAQGYGAVSLPDALARTYPNAERAWGWQYLFPSDRLSVDPRTGVVRRHHRRDRPAAPHPQADVRLVYERMHHHALADRLGPRMSMPASHPLAVRYST